MRWKRGQQSDDVVDRRGSPGRVPGGVKVGGGGLIVVLLTLFLSNLGDGSGGGADIGAILEELTRAQAQAPTDAAPAPVDPASDPDAALYDFMEFVVDDAQAVWTDIFAQSQQTYDRTKLVVFSGATGSGCGGASAAVGPHYCPLDQLMYVDLDFFKQLSSQFGAPGDFAQAYVIAHEVGHHIQNLTSIMDQVREAQRSNPGQANDFSIRLELQADCLAGVWGYTTRERGILEPGDLREGLGAAEAVGDDRIQEQATGTVNPESWTHGSAEQRIKWFRVGYDSGNPNLCNTFGADI